MKKCQCPSWARAVFGYKIWEIFQVKSCHLLYRRVRSMGEKTKISLELVGILIPDGYLAKDEDVVLADTVKEYGFTNAVIHLCPETLKKDAGENWFNYLLVIIESYSPNSYIKPKPENRTSRMLPALRMRLEKDIQIPLEELYTLFGGLTFFEWRGHKIATPLNEKQKKITQELGITFMEVLHEYK